MKNCNKCHLDKELINFGSDITRKDKLDGTCKKCRCDSQKARYNKDPEKYKKARRDKHAKDPSYDCNYSNKYRLEHPEYVIMTNSLESSKIAKKAWKQNNKDKVRAMDAKRNASEMLRTPKWLTKEHLKEIQEFYTLADSLIKSSGERIDVDHIIPLQGKEVSGLHVPWNLQLLSAHDNYVKGNRFKLEIEDK